MAKVKKVGFNFFEPTTINKNGDLAKIKLDKLFEKVRIRYVKGKEALEKAKEEDKENIEKRYKFIYKYNDEPARLADISIDNETQYYHLTFERLDYMLPSRTTLHGESKDLELDENEYIGHDVSVLYDSVNNILMVQRNRSSLGPAGIETFIRTLLNKAKVDFADKFELAMITDKSAKQRAFNQAAYRKIHLRISGAKANGIVEALTGNKVRGLDNVEISLNSATIKTAKLDNDFALKILKEYSEEDDVQKLQIKSREEEDDVVEPIDLIDQKLQAYTTFNFNIDKKNRRLNPISVFQQMINIYDVEEHGGFKSKILRM